jgi:quercetin dioxygenase-like cupin family protein
MQLVTDPTDAVDLTMTPIHLGRGSRALPVAGFAWDPDVLADYSAAVADDGVEGRMVMVFDAGDANGHWERHPTGDEIVVCLAGLVTVIRNVDGDEVPVELGPGDAAINPRGVWHVVDADRSARFLTITPGMGTEHQAR